MHPLLASQRDAARAALPPDVVAYVEQGHEDGGWQDVRLRPHVLRDVSTVDLSLDLFGSPLGTPVLVAPTAGHQRVHPGGEVESAAGAAAAGSLYVVSSRADVEVTPPGPWWWQSYVLRDRARTLDDAQRARDRGARAIVLTGDTPYLGTDRRDRLGDLEQDPSATLAAVGWLAGATGLPVLVKGLLRGDDAAACVQAGAAGVVVSNHGGRQLARAVRVADALADVVASVEVPVLVDGGVRSGADVLCALALGAQAVLVGRPVLWALSAAGRDGVRDCLLALTADLRHVLAVAGCASLQEAHGL